MADEGATFYYISKHFFDFEKICNYLKRFGLSIKHPDTELITGIGEENDFSEIQEEKIRDLVYNTSNLGVDLWTKGNYLNQEYNYRIFWSFYEQNNCFVQNFGFNYLEYDRIEKEISKIFIQFALQELAEVGDKLLGFTLDQFGTTEYYDFGKIFEPENKETLSHHCIPDITFLPREKMNQVQLDSESEIIRLNQSFDCIAREKNLSDYLKTLL
ncbi:MAG: hypothetical protein QNJ72_20345 [Pleurocapsa sp. MO_226.B13]|nr:hypothetical protein [Pleurocapsa sp. MO_226.B13]